MDVLSFGLGMILGVGVVCCCSLLPDYLARRKVQKKIKSATERIEFKQEMRDMVHCIVRDEGRRLKNEIVRYVDTKLAEKDKQEESENV